MASILNIIPNIPHDKLGHFVAGILCFTVFHFINPALAFAITLLMAIGKEVYDYYHKENHTPELMDAVATILGGVVGAMCGIPSFV